MDYTTISYNNLRSLAVSKGFEGTNPKRADLVAFLEALEPAAAAAVEEPAAIAVEAEVEAPAPVVAAAAKPAGEARKSDKIKARRDEIFDQVVQIFEASSQAMHWGGVVQKWEAMTNQKHDRVSWHDIGHALRKLCATGRVVATTPEKGRVVYTAVAG